MAKKKNSSEKRGLLSLFFGVTARTAMLMNGGVLVLSYLSMFINPAKAWFFTIFGILFLPLFLINLFLLVWALMRRSRAVVLPILALLPSLLLINRYIQFSDTSEVEDKANLKVVTYNVGRFMMSQSKKFDEPSVCRDSLFAFLRRTDADVISLQEYYTYDADNVKSELSALMPGYQTEYYLNVEPGGAYGNVILTKYPVVGKGKFDFEQSSNLAVYTDIRVGEYTYRVYDCHFESYNISIPRLVQAVSGKDNDAVNAAEEKMRSSITRRPQQVNTILEDIKASPVQAIVTGDFNDTPMSFTYNKLRKGRKDSFVEAGKGLGGTFSGLWPLIRIDYVLFPESWTACSHKVGRLKYSDHYPVTATIATNL